MAEKCFLRAKIVSLNRVLCHCIALFQNLFIHITKQGSCRSVAFVNFTYIVTKILANY